VDNDTKGWNQFKKIKLDRKLVAKRVKKAENATQRHAHRFVIKRIDNIRLVSREIITWLLVVGALIAGLGFQLAWGQGSYSTTGRMAGGLYVEGIVGQVDTLNPLYVSTSSEAAASRLLFSSLYNYDATGSLHQDVAQSMSTNPDGTEYTIKIRDDVSWHDKTPLTARDVVFTINLMKNPAVRSPLRINWLDVSAQAISNDEVTFKLPAAYAAFPHALTFPILPEHILSSIAPGAIRESTFSRTPIGSGPFSFRLLQAADTVSSHKVVHFTANKDYYNGAPKLDRFEIHAYTDEAGILKALKAGELSGAAGVSVTSVKDINTKRYTILPQPIDSGVYLLLNTNNPILKDEKVRKALQSATDTALLRKDIGGGVLPLDTPILENRSTAANLPHLSAPSIPAAAALLDEAGWKISGSYRMKEGQTLTLAITTTKSREYERAVANVEEQWKKIGVKVEKKTVDTTNLSSTFVQNTLQARNFDVLLYELSLGADPDVYAYWHSSQIGQTGYNFSNYSNKTADASLASARSRTEPDLRSAKYRQFVKQWQQDAPAIALYQPVLEYVTSDNVQTVAKDTRLVSEADRYSNVQYWTVGSDTVYKTP
jgi:peptide/nickel transport system substrate-binding protein